jgi:hypothetical protein
MIRARQQEKNRVIRRLYCTSGRACRGEESGLIRVDSCALGEGGSLIENLTEILNPSRLASERW